MTKEERLELAVDQATLDIVNDSAMWIRAYAMVQAHKELLRAKSSREGTMEPIIKAGCDHTGPLCICDGEVIEVTDCSRCYGPLDPKEAYNLGWFPPLCRDCIDRDDALESER